MIIKIILIISNLILFSCSFYTKNIKNDYKDYKLYEYVYHSVSIKNFYSPVEIKEKIEYVNNLDKDINNFKYIDESRYDEFKSDIVILVENFIIFSSKGDIDNQIYLIENHFKYLENYNKRKIEAEPINFSIYCIVYNNDVYQCQALLDAGYLCNYRGIWMHHNWSSFLALFNKLKPGKKAIIDGHTYTVSSITYGYVDTTIDGNYHFNNGGIVPYNTNKYFITCSGWDYGYAWGIKIVCFS